MTDAPPRHDDPRQLVAALLEHIQGNDALARLLKGAAFLKPTPTTPAAIAGDILHGAEEIAVYLYGDRKFRRRVYNLVETDRLPHFRLGASICSRKSILLRWIATQESPDRGAAESLNR